MRWIVDRAIPDPDALALVSQGDSPDKIIDGWVEKSHAPSAIRLIAHALPIREAVWWAWLCARAAAGAKPPASVIASLEATKTWIAEPTDPHRRAALDAAEVAGIGTPAGCAGLAAFLCGDTLGPAEAPPAPPGEYAAAKAIGGSINLAAVADVRTDVGARYAEFVRQGLELAERTKLWESDAPAKERR